MTFTPNDLTVTPYSYVAFSWTSTPWISIRMIEFTSSTRQLWGKGKMSGRNSDVRTMSNRRPVVLNRGTSSKTSTLQVSEHDDFEMQARCHAAHTRCHSKSSSLVLSPNTLSNIRYTLVLCVFFGIAAITLLTSFALRSWFNGSSIPRREKPL